ncbi:MAG: LysM peptidoglycan-binding domain-containing protein [Lachnospiraceae bacterium]|nr:LysM peptidoglycan-binding domain-containing protein [Lachnospiraceae bacterium]
MNYEYCNGYTHTIKRGDTLYALSRRYQVPLELLLRANPYVDVYNLQPGESLCIPVKKAEGCRFCLDNFIKDGRMADMPEESSSENVSEQVTFSEQESSTPSMDNMDTTVTMSQEQTLGAQSGWDAMDNAPARSAVNKQRQCKLVTERGETMASLLEKADMSLEDFLEKNTWDTVALLPGVAYKK